MSAVAWNETKVKRKGTPAQDAATAKDTTETELNEKKMQRGCTKSFVFVSVEFVGLPFQAYRLPFLQLFYNSRQVYMCD